MAESASVGSFMDGLPCAAPMRGGWSVLLVVALLAGCSSPAETPAPVVDFEDLELSAATGKGVVRGVVVDPTITPIVGAEIVLGKDGATATTDAEGRFGFSDVEPGLQILQVSKPGYGPVQSSVEVIADQLEPPLVTLVLERLPGTEPFVVTMLWDGFLHCSLTVGGVFATGCLIGDYTDDASRFSSPVDSLPTFLQSELVWEATQTLGTNLCMREYARASATDFEMLMDDVCGPSPLLQVAAVERLNETGVGAESGLERVVWVAGYGDAAAPGLALSQRFSVYTHLFYNFAPDAAWRFSVDGAPVPPS